MKRKPGKRELKERALVRTFSKEVRSEELIYALEAHHNDLRCVRMMQMLADPAIAKRPLATLARECGLTHRELTNYVQQSYADIGRMRAARHLPDIMEDIAVDSRSRIETCWKCDGEGKHKETLETCQECGGTGSRRIVGDKDARKMMLEATEILKRAPMIDASRHVHLEPDSLEETLRQGLPKLSPPILAIEEVK